MLAEVLQDFRFDPWSWALNGNDCLKHRSAKLKLDVRVNVHTELNQILEHFIERLSQELLLFTVKDVPILPE
jgi:hypothetical protein